MPDRLKQEQLVTLEKDALFELLPHVIKTYDNGALKLLFRAITEQHNFTIGKLRDLIRLQNPHLAALFTSSGLGELDSVYAEYMGLMDRWAFLTTGQAAYARSLETRLVNSLAAKRLESRVLAALAGNVGEKTYGGKLRAGLRSVIASAISRHHLKGSHSSVYALGLVTGVFEIAAKELWSRYSLAEPDNPSSLKNDFDFAYEPDHYPYFSPDGSYSGPKINQYPYPNDRYNPKILNDAAGLLYEETFKWCVPSLTSPYWYNSVINGKNPFGRFTREVASMLVSGKYKMSGGSDSNRAYALIPSLSGERYLFEAISYGDWANDVVITVVNNLNSTQNISLVGPRSKIKFKSSLFDLTIGADISIYPLVYPSIAVVKTDSQSYLDESTGREVPEYPLTTVKEGDEYTLQISDPSVHFQVDNRQLRELFGVVKLMFESIRPASRTIRKEHFGILVRDQVLYAPLFTLNEVRIRSDDGTLWQLVVDSAGTTSWEESDGEETITPIQYERVSRRSVRWAVTDSGVFSAASISQIDPITTSVSLGNQVWRGRASLAMGEYLVYYRSEGFNGFVYSENGILRTSITSPSVIADAIHTDGTEDESILREEYTKYAENPIPGTEPYMSEDATYDEEPDGSLQLQTSPEDSITVKPIVADYSGFHIDAHFGTEDETGFGSNWWYDMAGGMIGNDVRLRSAGIATGFLEPVPSGDSGRQDGLTHDYPIQFVNHHNVSPNRNRLDNSPSWSGYTYDAPDRFTGATRVDNDLEEFDGPIEGSVDFGGGELIPENGEGITPNYMCSGGGNGPVIDSLLLKSLVRVTQTCYKYVSITNDDGLAVIRTSRVNILQLGNFVYIETGPYAGMHRVIERVSPYDFKISTPYISDEVNGFLYSKCVETHVANAQDVTVKVVREDNISPFNAIVMSRSISGGEYTIMGTLPMPSEMEKEFTISVPAESIFYVFASTEMVDVITVTLPDNTIDLRGSLMFHGGDRSTPEITIIDDDDERFFDYNESGKDSYEPISGNKWWRGGTWRGTNYYTIHTTDRDGLPGVLIVAPTVPTPPTWVFTGYHGQDVTSFYSTWPLVWELTEPFDSFNVYRNEVLIANTTEKTYLETLPEFEFNQYTVSSVLNGQESEIPESQYLNVQYVDILETVPLSPYTQEGSETDNGVANVVIGYTPDSSYEFGDVQYVSLYRNWSLPSDSVDDYELIYTFENGNNQYEDAGLTDIGKTYSYKITISISPKESQFSEPTSITRV